MITLLWKHYTIILEWIIRCHSISNICVCIDLVSISYVFNHLFNHPTAFLLQAKCTTLAKLNEKLVWSLNSAKRSICDVLILYWSNVYYIYYMFDTQMKVATSCIFVHLHIWLNTSADFNRLLPPFWNLVSCISFIYLFNWSGLHYKLKKSILLSKWFLVKTNREIKRKNSN